MTYLATEAKITSIDVEALIGVKEARGKLQEMTDKGLLEKRGNAHSFDYAKAP